MTDGDMDPVLNRAIGELRTLPPVDPAAVTRIVKAAAEARVSAADDDAGMLSAPRWPLRWSLTVGLLTAAAFAGLTRCRTSSLEPPRSWMRLVLLPEL